MAKKATRTQHARRNIITSVINKLVIMLTNFILRTVLIKFLGQEYLGLDSLFVSILQILSLTELGISSAMVYSMYKPLAEDDTPAVCALLKLYRTVYRWIALAMTVIGLAITPFLPLIVKKDMPEGMNLYLLYFINLANTVLSYVLFAYRSSLFTADQRYSVNNNLYSIFKIGGTVLQVLALVLLRNQFSYYLYSLILPLTTVLKNLALYFLSNRMYPQYKCEGTVPKEEINSIKKRCAGMFLHKLSFVFRNSFDSIVISAFLGLAILGQYNTYYYIINAISGIMILVSNSVTASVGNSIVVESKAKNYADFNKLQLLYMWLTSWLTVCLVACTQPFIKLWVGEKMMFSDAVMIVFCIYFFTTHFSRVCHLYRQAAGLWWQDRYRPIVETVVNLGLNILLVKYLGVTGVMLSTIFCIVGIECTWGTSILFRNYFTEQKQSRYMLRLLWACVLTAISGGLTYYICHKINLTGIPALLVYGIIGSVISIPVFGIGSIFLPEFRPAVAFAFKVVGMKKIMAKIEKPAATDSEKD
ncbi:MAG: polysaccharide biosynthesis protein [Ruminococcaceae bacterium]|nr:polysaccharide biosynthesis protein [Oscillospiraceae bacterium]